LPLVTGTLESSEQAVTRKTVTNIKLAKHDFKIMLNGENRPGDCTGEDFTLADSRSI